MSEIRCSTQSTWNDRVDPHRSMTTECEPKTLLSSVHTDGPIGEKPSVVKL